VIVGVSCPHCICRLRTAGHAATPEMTPSLRRDPR
jgi:hypothetical protein